jgi:spore maturation protein CgeB
VRRVLVTSAVPDTVNTNSIIRTYLADGLREVLDNGQGQINDIPFELAADMVTQLRPDLVIVVGGVALDSVDLRQLRRVADATGSKIAFWLHDDPYEFDYAFRAEAIADVIFSNDSWAVHHYKAKHVHHLPLAGCPKRHFREILPKIERGISLFFCGIGYPNRVDLLRRAKKILEQQNTVIRGDNWPADLSFAKNQRLSTAEMADCAQHAMLTLNIGRDLNIANQTYELPPSTPGPRTFEIALAGCAQFCLVTDLEVTDYFTPDDEIILFDSIRDFENVLSRLAMDPEYFVEVGRAAQQRALTEHCYRNRAKKILEVIYG